MTAFPLSPLVPPPQNIWLPFYLLRKCWPVLSQSTSGLLFLFNCWYSLSLTLFSSTTSIHPRSFPSLSTAAILRVHFLSNAKLRSSNRHRFAVSWNSRRLRNSTRHRFVTLWNSSPLRNTLRRCLREVQALSPTTRGLCAFHPSLVLIPIYIRVAYCSVHTIRTPFRLCKRPRWTVIAFRATATPSCEGRPGLRNCDHETTTIINRCCKHPKRLRG